MNFLNKNILNIAFALGLFILCFSFAPSQAKADYYYGMDVFYTSGFYGYGASYGSYDNYNQYYNGYYSPGYSNYYYPNYYNDCYFYPAQNVVGAVPVIPQNIAPSFNPTNLIGAGIVEVYNTPNAYSPTNYVGSTQVPVYSFLPPYPAY